MRWKSISLQPWGQKIEGQPRAEITQSFKTFENVLNDYHETVQSKQVDPLMPFFYQ